MNKNADLKEKRKKTDKRANSSNGITIIALCWKIKVSRHTATWETYLKIPQLLNPHISNHLITHPAAKTICYLARGLLLEVGWALYIDHTGQIIVGMVRTGGEVHFFSVVWSSLIFSLSERKVPIDSQQSLVNVKITTCGCYRETSLLLPVCS